MSHPFEVQLEQAYKRDVLFALELLDAVTLSRVSQGVKKVKAVGFKHEPYLNASGYFVWLKKDTLASLQKITLDLGQLPYETVEIPKASVAVPLTTVQLLPRLDYPFVSGMTGIRGTLIEKRLPPPQVTTPIPDAQIRLRWLDDDNVTWRDAPTIARTNSAGDFVSVLRFAPADAPELDADRKLTVRVLARRGAIERRSPDLKLPHGRVADPLTISALTFAWDELQP
jgi:hypothetical protein